MLLIGPVSIAIAQATNVSLVYVIDSYRPIAGETVVSQLAFKCKSSNKLMTYTFSDIEKHALASFCLSTPIPGSLSLAMQTLLVQWLVLVRLCFLAGFRSIFGVLAFVPLRTSGVC